MQGLRKGLRFGHCAKPIQCRMLGWMFGKALQPDNVGYHDMVQSAQQRAEKRFAIPGKLIGQRCCRVFVHPLVITA